jgi:hypothetical protein
VTATTLTYLAARQRTSDALREAEQRRLAKESRRPRPIKLAVLRPLTRRAPRAASA